MSSPWVANAPNPLVSWHGRWTDLQVLPRAICIGDPRFFLWRRGASVSPVQHKSRSTASVSTTVVHFRQSRWTGVSGSVHLFCGYCKAAICERDRRVRKNWSSGRICPSRYFAVINRCGPSNDLERSNRTQWLPFKPRRLQRPCAWPQARLGFRRTMLASLLPCPSFQQLWLQRVPQPWGLRHLACPWLQRSRKFNAGYRLVYMMWSCEFRTFTSGLRTTYIRNVICIAKRNRSSCLVSMWLLHSPTCLMNFRASFGFAALTQTLVLCRQSMAARGWRSTLGKVDCHVSLFPVLAEGKSLLATMNPPGDAKLRTRCLSAMLLFIRYIMSQFATWCGKSRIWFCAHV